MLWDHLTLHPRLPLPLGWLAVGMMVSALCDRQSTRPVQMTTGVGFALEPLVCEKAFQVKRGIEKTGG